MSGGAKRPMPQAAELSVRTGGATPALKSRRRRGALESPHSKQIQNKSARNVLALRRTRRRVETTRAT